ncbi:MAG: 3',5'-cyclic-AMP phosphodiesterase [Methylobacter sp.]|nr:3',5'-cyclic-AMP phosphodiesterase [Methylobacter sp.]
MAQRLGYISVLQISDMHIRSTSEDTLLGVNTAHYFEAILDLAFAGKKQYDLILVTGDLAQDPCLASYQHILKRLEAYNTPCICLPGNHDDYHLMQKILNTEKVNCRKQMLLGDWQIICLNSQILGSAGGHLSKPELLFLEDCLNSHPEYYSLIAVHHHCLKSKTPWMDTMMIENSRELFEIIKKYPQVKAITYGHIHQAMDTTAASVHVFGTPSTCFQFKPGSRKFSVASTMPGYRVIQLYADGGIKTEVIRLPGQLTEVRAETQGY